MTTLDPLIYVNGIVITLSLVALTEIGQCGLGDANKRDEYLIINIVVRFPLFVSSKRRCQAEF